jgi:hypothetical protein
MRYIITTLLLLLSFTLNALEIDSLKRKEIVSEGQREFCQLLEYNSHCKSADQMKFTVVIDGNEPTYSRVIENRVDTTGIQILSPTCYDTLNAVLSRVYRDYQIEMYMIVIKTFDIAITTPLTQPIVINNLFNNPLYDEQTNLAQLRNWHKSITDDIIQNTLSARNRDCLVYSRAWYRGALIPGSIGEWMFSKRVCHYASNRTYPKLDELNTYFASRIINNPDVQNSGFEYSLQAVSREFAESAKYISLKAAILTTFTNNGISAILHEFKENVDWVGLTHLERVHILAVYSGYTMTDNGLGAEEANACYVVETTPAQQTFLLLNSLSAVSPLNSNPNYMGAKHNKALVVVLIDQIDDIGIGGDNYARFTRALTSAALSYEPFVISHLPTTDQQWLERQIFWDDSYITTPPVGTHKYSVDLQSNGNVRVSKNVVSGHELEYIAGDGAAISSPIWDTNYTDVALSPFDLVLVTNRSSLSMLEIAGAPQNQPYLAPAIFLKYCSDKQFNDQAIKTTAIVLSSVAVLTGPISIFAAVQAGNIALALFEGVQFVGAVGDLVANSSTSQEVRDAVQYFNIIVSTWGISRIATSATKYTVDYLSGVKTGQMKPVPLAIAENYRDRYKQITNWDNLDPAARERMRRMDRLLDEQLVSGSSVVSSQFSRFAIESLVGFEDGIAGLAAAHNLSIEQFIVLEGKSAADLSVVERNTMNNIRNTIAHPNASTIMQKVIPKSDINKYISGEYGSCRGFVTTAKDGKHLRTYEDIFFGMRLDYSNTPFSLNDGSCGVIRYTASNSADAIVPKSVINGGTETSSMPFTGHGFTSGTSGRLGVPEWKMQSFASINVGELWEVFSDGREVLLAKYDVNLGKFVPIQ